MDCDFATQPATLGSILCVGDVTKKINKTLKLLSKKSGQKKLENVQQTPFNAGEVKKQE